MSKKILENKKKEKKEEKNTKQLFKIVNKVTQQQSTKPITR